MRDLEDNLRDAVLDLADDAPRPLDLAAAARTKGRRIRRRRHIAFGAVAVALIAVTVTPYTVLRKDAAEPLPAATVSPSVEATPTTVSLSAFDAGKPYRLLGGAVITALSRTVDKPDSPDVYTEDEIHHVLLNRKTGRYGELTGRYGAVVPGPDGLIAAYGGATAEKTTRIVTASGAIRRTIFYRPIGGDPDPEWSPVDSRLLIPTSEGFAITDVTRDDDVRTGALSNCPDWCSLSWLPNGKEFAVTQRDSTQPRSEAIQEKVGSLDIYSAGTGKLVRSIKMTGRPLGTRAWSPDGRHVLVRPESGAITLADVRSGAPIAELIGSDALYLKDGRILTVDDEFVMLYDAQGRALEQADLPREFQGLTVKAGLP
ncbi:hypothetical protein FB565_004510 [Actinoplanes lutulentus]|uniref:WD40 repeat protein n=1 Tax=Actinoplanes lutulentus TaxID=1287878 RepID=A0A327ZBJ3_9ACTN|nr:WD40 repeat domain-containing protein [Actinoplanes lutulentus]MBB2944777.1 hypothetical protein [Actinoplanes lutulentus]RAK35429.1 hypothetical protein B0I29_110185 [Actinoplanes lutulentus]